MTNYEKYSKAIKNGDKQSIAEVYAFASSHLCDGHWDIVLHLAPEQIKSLIGWYREHSTMDDKKFAEIFVPEDEATFITGTCEKAFDSSKGGYSIFATSLGQMKRGWGEDQSTRIERMHKDWGMVLPAKSSRYCVAIEYSYKDEDRIDDADYEETFNHLEEAQARYDELLKKGSDAIDPKVLGDHTVAKLCLWYEDIVWDPEEKNWKQDDDGEIKDIKSHAFAYNNSGAVVFFDKETKKRLFHVELLGPDNRILGRQKIVALTKAEACRKAKANYMKTIDRTVRAAVVDR